jgi:hypothetical protein
MTGDSVDNCILAEDQMKKDLAYVSNYFKALVIPDSPDDFTVAERFRHGLTDDEIRKGIAAFRKFLYAFFDRLAAGKDEIDVKSGSKYDPYGSQKYDGSGNMIYCFPVLYNFTYILMAMGIFGRLEILPEVRLFVRGDDMLTGICPLTQRYPEKYNGILRMSNERKLEMFRLMDDLGFRFHGADFSTEVDFTKTETFYVTSIKNSFCVIGLKLIAEAAANNKNYIKMENLFGPVFLRGDFSSLANASPKKHAIKIQEAVIAQRPEIREWVIGTDKLLTGNGCKITESGKGAEFIYTRRNAGVTYGMVCIIFMGITGCFITPGVNHLACTDSIIKLLPGKTADIIKSGMESEKFNAERCLRRSGNMPFARFSLIHAGMEYEGCRHAGLRCQFSGVKCRFTGSGFRFDLSDPDVRKLMTKWLEKELAV